MVSERRLFLSMGHTQINKELDYYGFDEHLLIWQQPVPRASIEAILAFVVVVVVEVGGRP